MSVITFFEKLAGLQQDKTKQQIVSYRQLVANLATGKEPNPAEVDRLLADTGKSVENLRQEVERYQRRLALKTLVNSVPKLEAERREIDEQIAAANRALEAAEKLNDEVTMPLYATRRGIDQTLAEASRAASELVENCDDADLHRERAEIDAAIQSLGEEQKKLLERATFMEDKARSEYDRMHYEFGDGDKVARREVADKYAMNGETARREIKRLDKERADLDKRRGQVEQRMRQA